MSESIILKESSEYKKTVNNREKSINRLCYKTIICSEYFCILHINIFAYFTWMFLNI